MKPSHFAAFIGLTILFCANGALSQSDDWETLGEQTYNSICASCHQVSGQGTPGAFPPLAGHAVDVFVADGGRDYLLAVVLHGLQGEITVDDMTYAGSMPAWKATLSDEQAAAVLNHTLTSWGNADLLPDDAELFAAEEATEIRGREFSAQDVYALRGDVLGAPVGNGATSRTRSTLGGVYLEEQAMRGAEIYSEDCASCHAPTLAGSEAGPGIVGGRFDYGWNGKTVGELFAYVSANMPQDDPGGLKPEEYIDVVAYVLQQNGYPAGDDDAESGLSPDADRLRSIVIED